MTGFQVGDYVIADRARFDTFDGTFVVTKIGANAFGQPLVTVRPVQGGGKNVFYPSELSWEDGTRPESGV